jgi:hypothetical protein
MRKQGKDLPLDQKIKENIWDNIDDFLAVLNDMRAGRWRWVLNSKCKYVNLRVDMRDGKCIMSDGEGNRIDPKDLAYQYVKEQVRV